MVISSASPLAVVPQQLAPVPNAFEKMNATSASLDQGGLLVKPMELDAQVHFGLGLETAPASTGRVPIAELVRGTEPMPIDSVVAMLCEDVYLDESAGPDELNGWRRATNEEIPAGVIPGGGELDENGIFHGPLGMQGAIYVNDQGDYIVIYRGTDDAPDWMVNILRSFYGFVTPQDTFAMELAENMEREFPGNVIFGGHSLGGGHAVTSSLTTGAPAIVINPAGTSDAVLSMATARRNESQGTEYTENDLIDEANDGGIRVYQNEGDWVTLSQESTVGVNLPQTIGHRIPVADHNGLPAIVNGSFPLVPGGALLLDAGFPAIERFVDWIIPVSIPSLGIGGHHDISSSGNAVFTSMYAAVAVEGRTVTMLTPSGNRGLPPGDVVVDSITFADTPTGREAQRQFELTGKLPDDMVGVESISTSSNTFGASVTTTTYFGVDGIPTSTESVYYHEGIEIMCVDQPRDSEGQLIEAKTTYTFPVTPKDADEARILNKIVYGDANGPIQAGERVTVTMSQPQMESAMESDHEWQLEGGTGVEEATRFALQLATDDQGWTMAMKRIQDLAGVIDEPIEAIVDLDGG